MFKKGKKQIGQTRLAKSSLMDGRQVAFHKSKTIIADHSFAPGAKKVGRVPLPGESVHIVTRRSINSFDFILRLLKDGDIAEMYLAFYRIGKKTTGQLINLIKAGRISDVTIVINDGLRKLIPESYSMIVESGLFKIKECNNHTKIIACKMKGGYYVVEGSGNLSINARVEQYSFVNSKELYGFHKKWMKEI